MSDPDPLIKTPWNTDMSPEEFEAYYERKKEALKRECKRDGCTETTEFPRRYCGHVCEDIALREAAAKIDALLEERGK